MSRFTSPPDPIVFNRLVWRVVRRIPAAASPATGKLHS